MKKQTKEDKLINEVNWIITLVGHEDFEMSVFESVDALKLILNDVKTRIENIEKILKEDE